MKSFYLFCFVFAFLVTACGLENSVEQKPDNEAASDIDAVDIAVDTDNAVDSSDVTEPDDLSDEVTNDSVDDMPDEVVDETVDEMVDEVVDEQPDLDQDQGPQPYPTETPTSNKAGDIAANMTFYDHLGNMRTMEEFYQKKKVLWLAFLAYDCPYSNQLKGDITAVYKSEYVEKGFEIILIENGLLSGPQTSKEPSKLSAFRDTMLSTYSANADFVYGYLTDAGQIYFYKYITNGYPTNVIIDADTMKIIQYVEGWDSSLLASMEQTVVANLE